MSSPPPNKTSIDRTTTTPFHLKLFYRQRDFHSLGEFPLPSPTGPPPSLPQHLQIYTWPSCSLRELSHLLTTALPNVLPSPSVGTRLSFRLVYPDTRPSVGPDTRGRYVSKEMGSVVVAPDDLDEEGATNGAVPAAVKVRGDEADKTLQDARFVIGDYVDCAILPPLPDGGVAPPLVREARGPSYSAPGRGMSGPPGMVRENGFGRGRGGGYLGGAGPGFGRGGSVPSGEWRRGERLPDSGYGGRGYSSRGRSRGGY